MTPDAMVRILKEGLLLILILAAGPLTVAMLTGLVISLFQATTQLQEQTLSFVPKLLAISVTLAVLAPWLLNQSVRFIRVLLDSIALMR